MKEMLSNALLKTIEDIYVGEYSPDQKCYNICTLTEMLKINREMMASGSFSGYMPICIGSIDKVKEELTKIEEIYGRP